MLATHAVERGLSVFGIGHQAGDHPTPAAFDQGRYLRAALGQVE